MYRIIILGLLIFSFSSCNKDKIEVPVLPVSIYPNPFVDVFHITISSNPGGIITSVKVLDDKNLIHEFNSLSVPFNISVDMRDKPDGIYHIESIIDEEKYIEPILKVKTK